MHLVIENIGNTYTTIAAINGIVETSTAPCPNQSMRQAVGKILNIMAAKRGMRMVVGKEAKVKKVIT